MIFQPPQQFSRRYTGFTIIELVVSVAIVVVLIFAVGIVFRSSTRSVGVSQSLMDTLSNSAAIQQQMDADVSGINTSGFLIIRCGYCQDATTRIVRRCDQISFLANGSFPHRTGSITPVASANGPLTDSTNSPNALVWWGQLALCQSGGSTASPTDPHTYLPSDQTYHLTQNQVPTGQTESDLTLGRAAMLLIPKNSGLPSPPFSASDTSDTPNPGFGAIAAFQNAFTLSPPQAAIDYRVSKVSAISSDSNELPADITQSRLDAAAVTPLQIMAYLQQAVGTRSPSSVRFEADYYCYRRAALRSPYDSTINTINGYFRMHPIALQGVSAFAIDWTDGSLYSGGETDVLTGSPVTVEKLGTIKWFGMYVPPTAAPVSGLAKGGAFAQYAVDGPLFQITSAAAANGDSYTAIFSFDKASWRWPVALRFRYHIADPAGRLPTGRDIVQVIKVPT